MTIDHLRRGLGLLADHVDPANQSLWAEAITASLNDPVHAVALPDVLDEMARAATAGASQAWQSGDVSEGEALSSVARACLLLQWAIWHERRSPETGLLFAIHAAIHLEGTENENAGRGPPAVLPKSEDVSPLF